uniref:LRRCT domain-containing protein n=1 Tax=Poecilia mexicana TaxID=48701 RepID=A0A3B3WLE6_9TELE
IMRPALALLQSHCLLYIKPWFSPDSVYHEAPTVDCNNLLLTKLPLPIPLNTHTLRLQSNLLSVLDTAVLHGLPNLTDLDLSQNLPGLKFLDLNKNRIKLIETGDFKDMLNLKELGLNNMEELVSIDKASLDNLPELTKLEITNNPRLSYVHPQAFVRLSRLESLMLNSNSLSALHQNIMLSLPSLQEVSLHSNPLRCDCLFHWAARDTSHPRIERDTQMKAQVARVVRFIQPEATLCSAPPELRARRVREVSSGEMSASSFKKLSVPQPIFKPLEFPKSDSKQTWGKKHQHRLLTQADIIVAVGALKKTPDIMDLFQCILSMLNAKTHRVPSHYKSLISQT